MKKFGFVVLAVMFLSVLGYCEDTMETPKQFGGIVAGVASMSAVVTAINPVTRAVTLKNAEGKETTIICGPEVRNFAQINKGDTVNIDYSETVKIVVSPTASIPAKQESVQVSRAPLGEKPAGLITSTTQVNATVEAIDYEKRTVTLKGPQRTVTVEVTEEAVNFNKVKVGDTVTIEYSELLAISVTP
jgi:hypothetical protein